MLGAVRLASRTSLGARIRTPIKPNGYSNSIRQKAPSSRASLAGNWVRSKPKSFGRLYSTTPPPPIVPPTEPVTTFSKEIVVQDTGPVDMSLLEEIVLSGKRITNEAMIPISPETIALHIWLTLQHDLGIPLWAAMALTTWGIRTFALPLFFAQVRNMATLSLLSPRIQQIKQKMGLHEQSGDQVMVNYWDEKLKTLYKTFDVSPIKNFTSAFAIVPLMVAQAFSARYMLGHTPHLLEEKSKSGPLWLSDLTAVDPYYITPVLYVGLQLLILRLNLPMQSGIIGDIKNMSKTTWVLLGLYSAALGVICTQFPAAISTLWLYSMSFTALSNAVMYLPSVRRRLGIATSLPSERPSHLPPVAENPVKSLNQDLFRSSKNESSSTS